MSSEKTPNYSLHSWHPNDNVKRQEFNENFSIMDRILKDNSNAVNDVQQNIEEALALVEVANDTLSTVKKELAGASASTNEAANLLAQVNGKFATAEQDIAFVKSELEAGGTNIAIIFERLAKVEQDILAIEADAALIRTDTKSYVDGLVSTVNADILRTAIHYGATTGSTANKYLVSISTAVKSYTEGLGISVKINKVNTGACTINVNSLGDKSILKSDGTALDADTLKVGGVYTLRYNGTAFILQGEGGDLSYKDKITLVDAIYSVVNS